MLLPITSVPILKTDTGEKRRHNQDKTRQHRIINDVNDSVNDDFLVKSPKIKQRILIMNQGQIQTRKMGLIFTKANKSPVSQQRPLNPLAR